MERILITAALLATAACGDAGAVGEDDPTGGGGQGKTHDQGGQGGTGDLGGGGQGGTGGQGGFGGQEPEVLSCDGPGPRFATHVVSADYGPGQSYGQDFMPEIVLGPPLGEGCCAGSLDVVSLGNGGSVVLGFAGNGIVDGPGVDFVVFENPFEFGEAVFAELATVSVSEDGETWHDYPCESLEAPWDSCAGHEPVYLSGGDGPIDPATSGGDGFDLADVGLSLVRWVRITDRADQEGMQGVFDLDAVGIVNAACL